MSFDDVPGLYVVRVKATPRPGSEAFAEFAGAFINVFTVSASAAVARVTAHREAAETGWSCEAIESVGYVTRESFAGAPEGLAYFEQALVDGVVLVFHMFPPVTEEGEDTLNPEMPPHPPQQHPPKPEKSVLRWLLDSDPSLRWQVLRDLTDAPADEVAAERAKIATEGAGARLLALQAPDGRWGGTAWNRGWDSTMHVLSLLWSMGLDPASDEARRAVGLVRDRVTWMGCGPREVHDNPFFAGEVEPCINGQVAAPGAYFGQDVQGIVDRLLGEQLADGGWNCEAPHRSMRSSFHTTICVLEALLEHERAGGGSPAVLSARLRGEEYLLERHLFRRRSTGEVVDAGWTRFAFPTWWHYDVLRGLEYLRRAGVAPDERVAEAIGLVAAKRDDEGRWPLDTRYPGRMPVEIDEGEGRPSRWNTLRALRVLDWYSTRD